MKCSTFWEWLKFLAWHSLFLSCVTPSEATIDHKCPLDYSIIQSIIWSLSASVWPSYDSSTTSRWPNGNFLFIYSGNNTQQFIGGSIIKFSLDYSRAILSIFRPIYIYIYTQTDETKCSTYTASRSISVSDNRNGMAPSNHSQMREVICRNEVACHFLRTRRLDPKIAATFENNTLAKVFILLAWQASGSIQLCELSCSCSCGKVASCWPATTLPYKVNTSAYLSCLANSRCFTCKTQRCYDQEVHLVTVYDLKALLVNYVRKISFGIKKKRERKAQVGKINGSTITTRNNMLMKNRRINVSS